MKPKSPGKPLKRSVTFGIFLLFFASAALRIGDFGIAWATSDTDVGLDAALDTEVCTPDPSYALVIEDLKDREQRLAASELALEQRRVDIETSRMAVLKQLASLEEAEARLESRLASSSEASESDLAQLTAVYQAMKPKMAAELFEAMDPEFAAGFLARMAPESAAAVFSGLKPETAYAVSVVLAGRNANALKE